MPPGRCHVVDHGHDSLTTWRARVALENVPVSLVVAAVVGLGALGYAPAERPSGAPAQPASTAAVASAGQQRMVALVAARKDTGKGAKGKNGSKKRGMSEALAEQA